MSGMYGIWYNIKTFSNRVQPFLLLENVFPFDKKKMFMLHNKLLFVRSICLFYKILKLNPLIYA